MEMDIFSFPDEILSIVFEYVSQSDLVQSRLVSTRWKVKIDSLVSFRVKLNDSQPQTLVQNMLSRRVRSCEIVHLKLPFVATFGNPLFVKEIVFTNSSKENVLTLLRTCTDLEKIAFFTTFVGDKFFSLDKHPQELYRLKKLREIEVGIQVFNSKGDGKSSVFETIFANPQLVFPSLRRLFIHYPMCAREWVHVFSFIGRHAPTLKCLKLRCFECPLGIDHISQNVVKDLRKVNLLTLEIICNCSCGEYSFIHNVFSQIVAAQNSLETLTLDFHKCPLQGIKDVITKCAPTLQYVKLFQVEFGLEDDLQGSMFTKCCRLRELKFHCLPRLIVYVSLDLDEPGGPSKPISKGAETLGWSFPKCLKRFSMKSCYIPTEELIGMSSGCGKLEELELYEVGTAESYGYGLTVTAFISLVTNLQHLRFVYFRCASYSDSESVNLENSKWALVLEAGKEIGVYSESPRDYSDLFRIVNSNGGHEDENGKNASDMIDLSGLFTFKFETESKRHKFLDRIQELISLLDGSEPKNHLRGGTINQ